MNHILFFSHVETTVIKVPEHAGLVRSVACLDSLIRPSQTYQPCSDCRESLEEVTYRNRIRGIGGPSTPLIHTRTKNTILHKDPDPQPMARMPLWYATPVDILIWDGCWQCSINAHEDDASWLVQREHALVLQQNHATCRTTVAWLAWTLT